MKSNASSAPQEYSFQCNPEIVWTCACAKLQADPDIEGLGVIISFVLPAFLTIFLTYICLGLRNRSTIGLCLLYLRLRNVQKLWEVLWSHSDPEIQHSSEERTDDQEFHCSWWRSPEVWTKILERVLLSFSDTQLLSGLSILLTILSKFPESGTSITAYHFTIAMDLAMFPCISHFISLLVLEGYIRQNPLSRWIRSICMLTIAVLAMVLSVLEFNRYWYDYQQCPAYCLVQECLNANSASLAWSIIGLVPVFYAYIGIVFGFLGSPALTFEAPTLSFLQTPETVEDTPLSNWVHRCMKITILRLGRVSCRAIRPFALSWNTFNSHTMGFALAVCWFGYSLWWLVADRQDGMRLMTADQIEIEKQWSIGQILPLFVSIITLVTFAEAIDEERKAFDRNKRSDLSLSSTHDTLCSRLSRWLRAMWITIWRRNSQSSGQPSADQSEDGSNKEVSDTKTEPMKEV